MTIEKAVLPVIAIFCIAVGVYDSSNDDMIGTFLFGAVAVWALWPMRGARP